MPAGRRARRVATSEPPAVRPRRHRGVGVGGLFRVPCPGRAAAVLHRRLRRRSVAARAQGARARADSPTRSACATPPSTSACPTPPTAACAARAEACVAHGTAFGYRQDNGDDAAAHQRARRRVAGGHRRRAPRRRRPAGLQARLGEPARSSTTRTTPTRPTTCRSRAWSPIRSSTPRCCGPRRRCRCCRGRWAARPRLHERNVVEVRGFPLGAFAATNVGKVVSAFDHDDEGDWDHDDFVVDALLSTGNSGSPVLAVSCKTGEFELVGVYHAGYTHGSALNVVVGIDQLRDLMTTLKRTPRNHGESVASLDESVAARPGAPGEQRQRPVLSVRRPRRVGAAARRRCAGVRGVRARLSVSHDAAVRVRGSGAGRRLRRRRRACGLAAHAGVKAYDARRSRRRRASGGDACRRRPPPRRARVLRATAPTAAKPAPTRQEFERAARAERSLQRTAATRRDLAAAIAELSDRLAPQLARAERGRDRAFHAAAAAVAGDDG